MAKEDRVCEGYKIIDSQRVGAVEIVLGHHLTAPQPYVTWKTYEYCGFRDFYHGHYCPTHQAARIDFYERIKDAWENYEPAKNTPVKAEKPPEKGR